MSDAMHAGQPGARQGAIGQRLNLMTIRCPLCRLPARQTGRCVAFRDEAGRWYSFDVCLACTLRLNRLPGTLQRRQLDAAVGELWRHPDRYDICPHDSEVEAVLATKLRAAHLRGEF